MTTEAESFTVDGYGFVVISGAMSDNKNAVSAKGYSGCRTSRRGKYALARVAAGLTYRDLREKLGCSFATITAADRGVLPKNRHIRAAYLAAIGVVEDQKVRPARQSPPSPSQSVVA